ncbi:MAG TPA: hypothetical protein VGS12_10665 [Caulobacteraceae bacterium]|nr:hypothetical protein [Caulobacteraceae bacterium]
MILHVPPGSPALIRWGADALLFGHIGGGGLGIGSGFVSLLARKGGRAHRWAGLIFVPSMVVMGVIGTAVSPLIHQPMNANGGMLAVYLVTTSWAAVRRRPGTIGRFEIAAAMAPAAMVVWLWAAAAIAIGEGHSAVEGVPIAAPVVMGGFALIALVSDVRVIARRGVVGAARIVRHLWRMGLALFIATASLFLGQQQVFPRALRGSLILAAPVIVVIVLTLYWLVRTLRAGASRRKARPAPTAALLGEAA